MTANKGFGKDSSSKPKPSLNIVTRLSEVSKLIDLGNLESALSNLKLIQVSQVKRGSLLNSLGLAFAQRGDKHNAIDAFRHAVQAQPVNCEYLYNCSVAALNLELLDESKSNLEKLISISPDIAEAYYNLGNIYRCELGFEKAKECYEIALSLQSNNLLFIYNYALTLQDMNLAEDAISCYMKLLSLEPAHSIALNNIGNAYISLEKYELAVTFLEKALSIEPSLHVAHYNLANALRILRLLPKSIQTYRRALELCVADPDYYWNFANALLLNGEYVEGLENYEYRWQLSENKPKLHSEPPPPAELLWDGTNHCGVDEILLICEQGLGDAIQFLRYAKYLKNLGHKIGIVAPKKLHELIRISDLSDSVYSSSDVVKNFKWLPIMSLPRVLGVTPSNPLSSEPYIKTTSEKTFYWKEKIYSEYSFVISLNWSGNAQPNNDGFDNRALPLEAFRPLSSKKSVTFLSLQKGLGSEQLSTCSFKDKFVNCQQEIDDAWDFLDACAIMMNCGLIITSDTVVAHLAAALGRPTWLLLHANSEWRWGIEGDRTFWYPSVRLFRQQEWGNWDEVMNRVALELDKFLSDKNHLVFQEG